MASHLSAPKMHHHSWRGSQPSTSELAPNSAIPSIRRPSNSAFISSDQRELMERQPTKIISRVRPDDIVPISSAKQGVAFVNINELSPGLESIQVQRSVPHSAGAEEMRRKANDNAEASSDDKLEVVGLLRKPRDFFFLSLNNLSSRKLFV